MNQFLSFSLGVLTGELPGWLSAGLSPVQNSLALPQRSTAIFVLCLTFVWAHSLNEAPHRHNLSIIIAQ